MNQVSIISFSKVTLFVFVLFFFCKKASANNTCLENWGIKIKLDKAEEIVSKEMYEDFIISLAHIPIEIPKNCYSRELANLLFLKGKSEYMLGNFPEAAESLENSLKIQSYLKTGTISWELYKLLGDTYQRLAPEYQKKAIDYFDKAISEAEIDFENNYLGILKIKKSQINSISRSNKKLAFEESTKLYRDLLENGLYEEYLEFHNEVLYSSPKNDIVGDFKLRLGVLGKLKDSYQKHGNDKFFLIEIYSAIASCSNMLSGFTINTPESQIYKEKANKFRSDAIQLYKENNHLKLGLHSYSVLKQNLIEEKDTIAVLNLIQKRLISSSLGFEETSLERNPDFYQLGDENNIFGALVLIGDKMNFLYSKYLSTGNEKLLMDAYKCHEDLITIISDYSDAFPFLEKSMGISSGLYGMFVPFCFNVVDRYNKEIGEGTNENIFDLIELAKSGMFLRSKYLKEKYTLAISEKYKILRLKEIYYQKQMVKSKNKEYAEYCESKIRESRGLLNSNYKKEAHSNKIYLENMNSNKIISLSELQSTLKSGQVFINYIFNGRDVVRGLAITKDDSSYFMHTGVDVVSLIESNNKYIVNESGDLASYIAASSQLYELLVENSMKEFNESEIQHLIISPFFELTNLNFETLLTQEPEKDELVYDLPFLIKEKEISYAHSATFFFYQNINGNHLDKTLFVAPTFSVLEEELNNNEIVTLKTPRHIKTSSDLLDSVKTLNSSVKDLTGTDASKARIKDEIESSYNVIIFSTHGGATRKKQIFFDSSFIYTTQTSIEEDNRLFNSDLFDLESGEHNLVVIGACDGASGLSSIVTGKQTFAKAMCLGGTKSVVYSMWEVPEESTNTLIFQFMKYLDRGLTKSDAMRRAKLDILEGKSYSITGKGKLAIGNSHPFYWAGLVLEGNTNPIGNAIDERFNIIYISLFMMLLIIPIWLILKKRNV